VLSVSGPSVVHADALDLSRVRESMRRAVEDLRPCVEAHHLGEGRYVVTLEVDGAGRVRHVLIEESPADLGLAAVACMESVFRALTFPSVSDPTRRPIRRDEPVSHLPPRHRSIEGITIHYPFFVVTVRAPGSVTQIRF